MEPVTRELLREHSEGPAIMAMIQNAKAIMLVDGAPSTAYDQRCIDLYHNRITIEQALAPPS